MSKLEKRLTAKDVCLIIDHCKDAGIAELMWGDFKITFLSGLQQMPTQIHVPPAIVERQDQIEQSAFVEEDLESHEEMLQRLKVEDPVEFEKMLLAGELEMTTKVGGSDGEEAGSS